MKNLANCTPVEFLVQSNRIRNTADKWLKDTGIFEIRKNKPSGLKEITDDMPEDEKAAARQENNAIKRKQAMQNLSDMLDAALEKYPQETMELIALMCFIEPEHINDHKPTVYLKEIGEMLADKDIIDFFTSLMRLADSGILNTASE